MYVLPTPPPASDTSFARRRLWVNDHYEAAVKHGCFGVHMGQSDLKECLKKGGLEVLLKVRREAKL